MTLWGEEVERILLKGNRISPCACQNRRRVPGGGACRNRFAINHCSAVYAKPSHTSVSSRIRARHIASLVDPVPSPWRQGEGMGVTCPEYEWPEFFKAGRGGSSRFVPFRRPRYRRGKKSARKSLSYHARPSPFPFTENEIIKSTVFLHDRSPAVRTKNQNGFFCVPWNTRRSARKTSSILLNYWNFRFGRSSKILIL